MAGQSGHDGFAPADYSDGRERHEWRTDYPEEALNEIKFEAKYLSFWLFLPPIAMLVAVNGPITEWLMFRSSEQSRYPVLVIAWLGGTLGGTAYGIKWLYHVVGKGWWHEDRRLWRLLTPHISGAVSFSFIALISSETLSFMTMSGARSLFGLIGISFLLGYFSDTAVGKLSEIASVLFGTVKDHEPSEPDDIDEESAEPDDINDDTEKVESADGE